MRPTDDGGATVDRAELELLAKALPVVAGEVWSRDRVRDPLLERLIYDARLCLGQLGAPPTVVASVTCIADAPSLRRWVVCVDCGEETDRPRRGLCDRCRKRAARAG